MASSAAATRERRWWTKNEDKILQNAGQLQINEHGTIKSWNDLADLLPGRTNKDCRKRWYKVRLDIRKGAWMPEEDQRLREAVNQVGIRWSVVAEMVQTRNADQCAKRWRHVLGPHIKHGPWSPEEDKILLESIAKYGHNWKDIGLNELPGRSPHDIRNRSVALDRRARQSNSDPGKSPEPVSPASSDGTSEEQFGDSGDDFSSESYAASGIFDNGTQAHAMFLSSPIHTPGRAMQTTYNPGMDFVMSGAADIDYHSYGLGNTGQSSTERTISETLQRQTQSPHLTSPQDDPSRLAASLAAAGLMNFSEADFIPNPTGQYPFQLGHLSDPTGCGSAPRSFQGTPAPQTSDIEAQFTQSSISPPPPAKGHVTIFMGQGDLDLAQDVMGSLKQLDVDITMHLVRNNSSSE
ncbi:hypothetical protein QBC38DRAFT_131063 [Podospora fimiseda]|uniref:Uncharacterized protein n=1 Tax=Podospora fimiseda TaxID=252190 RepID=A0AAN6YP53_9PEZI|nr:hypothetical protein QBC38DRAFT_131063 [Podospora fimiseda]